MSLRDALQRPIVAKKTMKQRSGRKRYRGKTTLLNVLAPDGIDVLDGQVVQVGDSFITTMELDYWPARIPIGWLADPGLELDQPGVIIHQRIRIVAKDEARQILSKSEEAAAETLLGDEEAGKTYNDEASLGMFAAMALRQDIAADLDCLVQYNITITIADASYEGLQRRVHAIRSAAEDRGIGFRIARFQQWHGYVESLPLAISLLSDSSRGRTHDTSGKVTAKALPVRDAGLPPRPDGQPIVFGEHPTTGEPIEWDSWVATSPHVLAIARTGGGKSYLMGGVVAQEVALGNTAVLILDPKDQEWRPLVTALNGIYISLSRTAGYHINPLTIPNLTPERARLLTEVQEEDLLGQRISFVKALVVRELRDMGTHMDGQRSVRIERAIEQAYDSMGITTDPATWCRPMPTFSTVKSFLEKMDRDLATDFEHFTDGTVGALFNHPDGSNIPTNNPVLGIDLFTLLQTRNEELERLLPVIIMDFFVNVGLHRPTGRRSHLLLDEGHALLKTEAGAKVLEMIYRIGRSLGFKATIITQRFEDLENSPYAQMILEGAATKIVLGLETRSEQIPRAAALLGLNEEETRWLYECRKENGIASWSFLMADGINTKLKTPRWPETIHRIVSPPKKGGKAQ